MDNRISYSMDDETFNRILKAISDLVSEMPFLIDLDQDQKKSLLKFGDKSYPFMTKTLEIGQQHPDIIPRTLDLNEMAKDAKLYSQLNSFVRPLRVLLDKIEDTMALAGSEAYSSGLLIYKNIQTNKALLDGAEVILEDLSRRFAQKSSSEDPQPVSSAS